MRKIPAKFENPIDNVLLDAAEAVCPLLHATGHTPNVITAYSCVAGAYALLCLYRGDFAHFAVAWVASYFLDCVDGHYARKYSMVTVFGDYLDHISDALQAGLAIVLILSYKPPPLLVVLLVVNMCLTLKHFGCQEKMYKKSPHYDGVPANTIDGYERLCKRESDIAWTRLFGSGTMHFMIIAAVWYVMQRVPSK